MNHKLSTEEIIKKRKPAPVVLNVADENTALHAAVYLNDFLDNHRQRTC